MITGGVNVATSKLIATQQAKGKYVGAFNKTRKGDKKSQNVYSRALTSAASQWGKHLPTFKKFQKAIVKYGVQTGLGDLSFETFIEGVKYRQRNKPTDSVPALHSGLTPKNFAKQFYQANTLEEYRKLYIKFMTDFVLEEHARNLEAAQKNYDKVQGGLVPSINFDITKLAVRDDWVLDEKTGQYVKTKKLKEVGINLNELIEGLTSEGTLARRAKPDYFHSNLSTDEITRKDARERNWIESWWVNLQYSLTEMGWTDVLDWIQRALDSGASIEDIYEKLFKSTYYNFVFNYNDKVSANSPEHQQLLRDIMFTKF